MSCGLVVKWPIQLAVFLGQKPARVPFLVDMVTPATQELILDLTIQCKLGTGLCYKDMRIDKMPKDVI